MIELILFYLFLFIFGSVVGSFLNVVADRTSRDEGFVKGKSKCESCKQTLAPKDLIPLFSFISLKGKCRYCKTKLSLYYPFAEILTGLVFVLTFIVFKSFSLEFYKYLIIFCFYIALFLADAKYNLIPNKIVYPAILFTFFSNVSIDAYRMYLYYTRLASDDFGKYVLKSGYFNDVLQSLIMNYIWVLGASVGIGLFFLFLVLITKGRGMGAGDIRLGFLIGLVNGFPLSILAIFLGFVFGAFISLGLILVKIKKLKDTIAFGPFLIMGSIVALFFGKYLLNLYLSYGR